MEKKERDLFEANKEYLEEETGFGITISDIGGEFEVEIGGENNFLYGYGKTKLEATDDAIRVFNNEVYGSYMSDDPYHQEFQ